MKVLDGVHTPSRIHFVSDPFGEAAVDQEDKIVVPPRKEPKVEKKKKMEHEHESEFGEEKESKERKEKALKEIEMGNAAYKATVLYDLHAFGLIKPWNSTFWLHPIRASIVILLQNSNSPSPLFIICKANDSSSHLIIFPIVQYISIAQRISFD
ncbi:hypothetical protein F2Q70_00043317 [Brassica cretica]|uniref:Uncharacterized protein n=1 Tax=Brassica cretica TaxID=69181 RepID=A0A8S9KES8_BRACR|nr:hypothetical protein F2Q70_00043317 [Brassica cretica]